MLHEYLQEDFAELKKKGYQVIKKVVSDVDVLASHLLADVEALRQRHNVPSTSMHLLQQYGAGQWQSVWQCRIKTIPIWKSLYKTDRLLSSWDGVSVVSAHDQVQLAKTLNAFGEPNWIHRDQRLTNYHLADTIQGYLSLSDGCEDSYSTIFYVPRHGTAFDFLREFHAKFYTRYNKFGRKIQASYHNVDYYEFNEAELSWLREHGRIEKPILKKGDMLLWCSSTPHAAAPSQHCGATVNSRLGCFVSMYPKHLATRHTLSQRKALAKLNATSSHNVLSPTLFPFHLNDMTLKEPLPSYSDELQKMRAQLIA